MEERTQHQVAFYLTGRKDGSGLQPMSERFSPALLSRYSDLSSLRYDFPLILNRESQPDRALLSLSALVDVAVENLGAGLERDRIARHGYRIERELRRRLKTKGSGDFADMWEQSVKALASPGEPMLIDSAERLWSSFRCSGDIVDVDSTLPIRVVRHVWGAVQAEKARAFRQRAERLLHKLRDVLAAELMGSTVGRSPDRLQAAVGSSFAASFDFEAMSRILVDAKPSVVLSEGRRERIRGLIATLERQRFFAIGTCASEPYCFEFERCADALSAYQARHEEAVELAKTLVVAELEANGSYRESVHDVIFERFGANGLDSAELAELPDYLICTGGRSLDAAEMAQLVELLAAGLPFKVLVQTDDILEPSAVAEGHVALGIRSRQLVDTAIGLTDVFAFQGAASHLFKGRGSVLRGLEYDGPALFSVFSGANGHSSKFPAYLVSAAAMESRAFPALVYDPSKGVDWASRLSVEGNSMPESDWPAHDFRFEGARIQAETERLSFTLADFMAMDERFHVHFAVVPKDDWSDAMLPVPEALGKNLEGLPSQLPSLALVDDEGWLQRAIFDDRTLKEVRRCLAMWRSLQELAGIHNSHAERLLAQERMAQEQTTREPSPSLVEPSEPTVPVVREVWLNGQASATEVAAAEEVRGDEPYIETARCTSCNECTQINNKMFAYNENKQAFIKDVNAGTFRQLVEAAEGCQVSIIHPGKPKNPNEPGIEDLLRRAAAFN